MSDEIELLRSFRRELPGPSTDAWVRARAAVAAAAAEEGPLRSSSEAAGPAHVEGTQLKADIPVSIRARRRQASRWSHRVWVIAVAAAILVVFFVPLPHLNLFRRIVSPSGQLTPSGVPPKRAFLAPLADVAATPKGWSPISSGNVQISVPSSWLVYNDDCSNDVAGIVFVAEPPRVMSNTGCTTPANVVSIGAARRSSITHGRTAVVNDIHVSIGWSRAGTTLTYTEWALGMEVTASGPLAQRVLRTITHSPLSVVLGSDIYGTPEAWRTVIFGGLEFSVPGNWQVTHVSWWGGCPYDIAANTLQLSAAQSISSPSCPAPPTNAGYEAAVAGMVVGAGPKLTASSTQGDRCVRRDRLRICVEPVVLNGSYSSELHLGLLTAEVFLPGTIRPDLVEIGLAGSGITPLRIFDSLRPAETPASFLARAQAGLEGDYSAVYQFSGPTSSTENEATVTVAQRAPAGRSAWPGGRPGEWSYRLKGSHGFTIEWLVRGSTVENCWRWRNSRWRCTKGDYPGDAGGNGYTIATEPFLPGTAYSFLSAIIDGASSHGALVIRAEQSRFGSLTCLVVKDPAETYCLTSGDHFASLFISSAMVGTAWTSVRLVSEQLTAPAADFILSGVPTGPFELPPPG